MLVHQRVVTVASMGHNLNLRSLRWAITNPPGILLNASVVVLYKGFFDICKSHDPNIPGYGSTGYLWITYSLVICYIAIENDPMTQSK